MSFDTRRLTTAGELKALAHPLRLAIMEQLGLRGPLTASELGDVLDETPANCSWHLRKLAQHGLVEETHEGHGRRRPWRAVSVGHTWDEQPDDPVAREAGRALTDQIIDREVARFRHNKARNDDADWDLGAVQNSTWMTAEEAADWHRELSDLAMRFRERIADGKARPEQARLVRILMLASVDAP